MRYNFFKFRCMKALSYCDTSVSAAPLLGVWVSSVILVKSKLWHSPRGTMVTPVFVLTAPTSPRVQHRIHYSVYPSVLTANHHVASNLLQSGDTWPCLLGAVGVIAHDNFSVGKGAFRVFHSPPLFTRQCLERENSGCTEEEERSPRKRSPFPQC
jgi:hypothetical protein